MVLMFFADTSGSFHSCKLPCLFDMAAKAKFGLFQNLGLDLTILVSTTNFMVHLILIQLPLTRNSKLGVYLVMSFVITATSVWNSCLSINSVWLMSRVLSYVQVQLTIISQLAKCN